jgi:methyltransferase (TIGR00027 family)
LARAPRGPAIRYVGWVTHTKSETGSSAINDVSDTALMVAVFRAIESERPDALFRDRFAAKLAGERGRNIVSRLSRRAHVGYSVVVRTVVIDDFVRDAIARGVDTVLNLGAGLDARPYRMDLPPTLRWIEVDVPSIIEQKTRALEGETPRCRLSHETFDLRDRERFRALLADAAAGSSGVLVLTEGVIPYLTAEDVAAMARDLRSRPEVRSWIVDYFSRDVLRYRERSGMSKKMKNAPFRFAPDDWFGFFEERGWKPTKVRYLAEEGERMHRPIPFPRLFRAWVAFTGLFATAEPRAALKRFVAYATLEPSEPSPASQP